MSVTKLEPKDNNITTAAKELIQQNEWYIVPLEAGSKSPRGKDWSKRTAAYSQESSKKIPANLKGIGLAHAHSGTVAIDFDKLGSSETWWARHNVNIYDHLNAPDAVKIVSGRENRAKLLYKLPVGVQPLQSIKKDRDGFELRCASKKATTLQDVLPPSIHPTTHRAYKWEGDQFNVPILPNEILIVWQSLLEKRSKRTFTDSKESRERYENFVDDALSVMNPDIEYNDWLAIGMALDSVGWGDKWSEWSEQGKKFVIGDTENRLSGFTDDGGVGLGTFFKLARQSGWNPAQAWERFCENIITNSTEVQSAIEQLGAALRATKIGQSKLHQMLQRLKKKFGIPVATLKADLRAQIQQEDENNELTHEEIAMHYWSKRENLINTEGALWEYNGLKWLEHTYNNIVHEIGIHYKDQKLCRTGNSQHQIARLVVTKDIHPSWFAEAPKGICTPKGFFKIDDQGELIHEHNVPEHRQRYAYPCAPVDEEPKLLLKLLECVQGEGVELVQEFTGAILFNLATTHQRAMLLYGDTGTGKSAFIKLLQLIIEKHSVIPPYKLTDDYHVAELAGSMLNTHTELPSEEAVDSSVFKAIISGDVISARRIREAVFEFAPVAGHIYSSNHLPTVSDPEKAFWRRWVMTRWAGEPSETIADFEHAIYEKELGQILHWSMLGAQRLVKNNCYSLGNKHKEEMAKWTEQHNVVKQCIYADDSPFVITEKARCKQGEFAKAVIEWSLASHMKPPTRRAIIAMGEESLAVKRVGGYKFFTGIGIAIDAENGR